MEGRFGAVVVVEDDSVFQSWNYFVFQAYLTVSQQRDFLEELTMEEREKNAVIDQQRSGKFTVDGSAAADEFVGVQSSQVSVRPTKDHFVNFMAFNSGMLSLEDLLAGQDLESPLSKDENLKFESLVESTYL